MYRYRKFTLGDGSVMMVRTEVHGAQNRGGKKQLLQAYAINEWCDRTPLANRWRAKLVNFVGVGRVYEAGWLPADGGHEEQPLPPVEVGGAGGGGRRGPGEDRSGVAQKHEGDVGVEDG